MGICLELQRGQVNKRKEEENVCNIGSSMVVHEKGEQKSEVRREMDLV